MNKKYLSTLALLSVTLLIGVLAFFPIQSSDVFAYLNLARYFFAHGQLPTQDFYGPEQAGNWYVSHQYLSYFVFYGIYEALGLTGIIGFKTALLVIFFTGFAALALRDEKLSVCVLASFYLSIAASMYRWIERSSVFSDLLSATLIAVMAILPPKRAWILPLVFWLWVQLHPGYPVGWLIFLLFILLDKNWRSLRNVGWFAASVAAGLINPKGLQGLLYPLTFALKEAQIFKHYYLEWMSPLTRIYLRHWETWAFFALVLLVFFVIRRERKPVAFSLLVLVAVMGLSAARFLSLASFCLFVITVIYARPAQRPVWLLPLMTVANLILACLIFAFGYPTAAGLRKPGGGVDPTFNPVGAAEFIKNLPLNGNIFNSHGLGDYLGWALNGHPRVFYHGFMTDLSYYETQYLAFYKTPERFDQMVASHHLVLFALDKTEGRSPVLASLQQRPSWQLIYEDQSAWVYLLKDPGALKASQ